MNRSLLFLLVLVYFSQCVPIPTYVPRISLGTTQTTIHDGYITNVYMIGTGRTSCEILLENLYNEMREPMKSRSITTGYAFLGKTSEFSVDALERISIPGYNAFLVFRGSGDPLLDMSKEKTLLVAPPVGRWPGGTVTRYGNQYRETFTLTLYKREQKLSIIWQGQLDVDFDLASEAGYRQIAKLLMEELVRNKIVKAPSGKI